MQIKAGDDHIALPKDFDTLTDNPLLVCDDHFYYPLMHLKLEQLFQMRHAGHACAHNDISRRARPVYFSLMPIQTFGVVLLQFYPSADKDYEVKMRYFPHRKEV